MDIALDRAQDDLAFLGGACCSSAAGQLGLDDVGNLFQHLAGHDEFGQEIIALLIALADDVHSFLTIPQDAFEVAALLDEVLNHTQGIILSNFCDSHHQFFSHLINLPP